MRKRSFPDSFLKLASCELDGDVELSARAIEVCIDLSLGLFDEIVTRFNVVCVKGILDTLIDAAAHTPVAVIHQAQSIFEGPDQQFSDARFVVMNLDLVHEKWGKVPGNT